MKVKIQFNIENDDWVEPTPDVITKAIKEIECLYAYVFNNAEDYDSGCWQIPHTTDEGSTFFYGYYEIEIER